MNLHKVVILSAAKNPRIFGAAAGFSPRSGNTPSGGLQPRVVAVAAVTFLLACTAAAQGIPNIKPGDTCEKLRAAYGNESSQEGPAHIWKQDTVETRVLVKPNGPCVADTVEYYIQPGHTFQTRDGIIVGKDTTADASLKLKARIKVGSFYFVHAEGKAYAMLDLWPTPAFPYKTTYGWQLDPSLAGKLKDPPHLADFTREPAFYYSITTLDPRETQ